MLGRVWRYVVVCVAVGVGSPAGAVTYSFDNYLNATNDFSISSGGQTATFSSSSGPGTLVVTDASDTFTFPVAFGGFGNLTGDPLTIAFTDPAVDRIIIPFGVFEAYATAPATLVATSNTGQAVPFTTAFYNLISGSPEGVINFTPTGPISALTLTSSMAFAIASVDVQSGTSGGASPGGTVDVSEPGSMALLTGGLITVALMRRRMGLAGRPSK